MSMTEPITTAQYWLTNSDLIRDVATLGYLSGSVLDCTYGLGTWWEQFTPTQFIASDIAPSDSFILQYDFTDLPFPDNSFDTVCFDPPYKLNGTPSDPDLRYGTNIVRTWQERHTLMKLGLSESIRVTRRYVLMKCMDQVAYNHKRWQTFIMTSHAYARGCTLADRFDMLHVPRAQPQDRPQIHSRQNYSTLLIFEKR